MHDITDDDFAKTLSAIVDVTGNAVDTLEMLVFYSSPGVVDWEGWKRYLQQKIEREKELQECCTT